jgi:Family of unknown function (DUF6502)
MEPSNDAARLDNAVRRAALRILYRLVRVLLRHGVSFQAFGDLAKQAYVDVARQHFALPGRKLSISRVSVLTGLTRKEVQRLLEAAPAVDADARERHNRAARVLTGWVRDADFRDGEALRALPFEGPLSFSELVRRYGGDVPARAVLDELLRVGSVERDEGGTIRPLSRGYLPRRSDVGKLAILGSDVSLLIDTIDHNLQDNEPPRFQRKVMYDNLPAEAVEQLRPLAARQGQELLEQLDAWMAQHDRDANPAVRGSGRHRAGVGVFYFEEDLDDANREK